MVKREKRKRSPEPEDEAIPIPAVVERNNLRVSGSRESVGKEIDLKKIPSTVFSGLRRGDGQAALLQAEELEKEGTEVWIFQCTKNVNLAELLEGKKLKLEYERLSHLRGTDDNGREYVSMCIPLDNENGGNIATLLPDRSGNTKLVSTPLSGYIMLRESVEELPAPFFNVSPPHFHQLPSGLKHRHPVYGVDFSELLSKMEMEKDSDPELSPKKAKKDKQKKKDPELFIKEAQKHKEKKKKSRKNND